MKKLNVAAFRAYFKKIDYRHYICAAITVGFALISAFVFPYAFPRLMEACRDFGLSFAYWFVECFNLPYVITPSVTAFSKMPFSLTSGLAPNWEDFTVQWNTYWQAFANKENILAYLAYTGMNTANALKILSILIPLIAVFIVIIKRMFEKKNNKYNVDTKPLKAFKRLSDISYRPIRNRVVSFVCFVRDYRLLIYSKRKPKKGEIIEPAKLSYMVIWAIIWAFSFNLFSIVLEAFAFYNYFSISFDVLNIYRQVYKLFLDLSVMVKFVPVPVWVLVGLYIFDRIRKARGYKNLEHMEAMNRGFINERGVFSLFVAPMRQGKTKMSTSFALSREVMFRDTAYEIILKSDLKFPYFPWINLENSLRAAIDKRSVYNLATVRRFVRSKISKFNKRPEKRYIFDYDFERYAVEYNNGMYIEKLASVLEDYAQAYFIYIVQTSLIVSNYSIRVDNVIDDIGNFPLWRADFFRTDSRLIDSYSRHSHIIDYDALRLGKKLVSESRYAFEFGVIDITEIAKERLNMLEAQSLKKDDEETNQKNDGFESWVKMCGHSATVAYKCFVSIYADDQREQNLCAGLREVGEIIRIEDVEKDRLAMPFFFVGELIYDFLHSKFIGLHRKTRYNRGDNCLLYYLIHTVVSKFEAYYNRIYNIFGYEVMQVSVQDGAQNNEAKLHDYYISTKKDLSKRYSTDCLSDTLAVRALRATWGLDDLPTYKTERPTFDETLKQNSFFIRDITETLNVNGKSDKKKKTQPPAFDTDKLSRFFGK